MNSLSIYKYWTSKYEDTFNEEYPGHKKFMEYALFKRLLNNFNHYIILEAIDSFFSLKITKDKASVSLFSSKNYFNKRFDNLIREKDIIKYKRLLPWYSINDQNKIKTLLQRYKNYLYAISLTNEDLEDMKLIIEKLSSIPVSEEM